MSIINNPNTIYYHIARASTLEEWEKVNNNAHDLLDHAVVMGREQNVDLDNDPHIANLNSIASLTHEIVSLRRLAHSMNNPQKR